MAPSLPPRRTYALDGVCLLSSAGEIFHPGLSQFTAASALPAEPRLVLVLCRSWALPCSGRRAPTPFGSTQSQ